MADGDYYEIIDKQVQGGQTILNVYVYRATGTDSNAIAVADTFNSDLLPSIAALQSGLLQHVETTVNNLMDLSDFANIATAVTGAQGGDALPPYDAVALFYQRTTRASRNGWKRIAGVPENHQNNGTLDSTILASWVTIANLLLGPVVSTVHTVTLVPYIWRRPNPTHVPPIAQAFFPVGGIIPHNAVTTQNTRKYGRGI